MIQSRLETLKRFVYGVNDFSLTVSPTLNHPRRTLLQFTSMIQTEIVVAARSLEQEAKNQAFDDIGMN